MIERERTRTTTFGPKLKNKRKAKERKAIKHKDKDKPKRPLSAYNYFFKEEHQKIVKAVFCEDESSRKKIDPDLTVDQIKKLKTNCNGNVNFEEIGKVIGSRWKVITQTTQTPDRVSYYASLAKYDVERYEKEKEMYSQKKEHKEGQKIIKAMLREDESCKRKDATETPDRVFHYASLAKEDAERFEKDKAVSNLKKEQMRIMEERRKIIKTLFWDDESFRKKIDPDLTVDRIKKLNKDNGNVIFEENGKTIGSQKKVVTQTPDRVSSYSCASLVTADAEHFEKDKMRMMEERRKIRKDLQSFRKKSDSYLNVDHMKKDNGDDEMGKIIRRQRKVVTQTPDRVSHCASLAKTDTGRFEMDKEVNDLEKEQIRIMEERQKIIKALWREDESFRRKADLDVTVDRIKELKKHNGNDSFEEILKTISSQRKVVTKTPDNRWRVATETIDRAYDYASLPKADIKLYEKEKNQKIIKAVDFEDESSRKKNRDNSNVSFEEIGKIIYSQRKIVTETADSRWTVATETLNRASYHTSLAKADVDHYEKDMEVHNQKEEQMRYNAEQSCSAKHATEHQIHYHMQDQQSGMITPQSEIHHHGSERKQVPASARKPVKRRDKDKPKRPLSAYNYFFKEEHQKIKKAAFCDDKGSRKKIDPDLTVDQIKKLKRPNGNVSFEEMGKIIGSRWRVVTQTPDRASYYASLAKADTGRYEKEKEMCNQKKEQMRCYSERACCTTQTPGHQMQNQQPIMITPPHGHMGYNNSYRTETAMIDSYNPCHRSDTSRVRDRHYFNNSQNNSGINFQQRSESYNSYGHPIPMSNSQALQREHKSYPHEQYFNNQGPHYQAYSAQHPGVRSDVYYSYNQGYQHT